MLDLVRVYLVGFGVVTIAGGVLGFVKAKSKASIIAGSISGAALVAAGALVGGAATTTGLALGFAVSLALTGRFGNAYRQTKKLMPAGLIAVLGAGGMVLTLLAFRR
ncbi:MAG: TMEM14 family protein [Labilithrix sp.]|nr:TMEM14 family protein [Labilithrix sp.]MCW5812343.1 TMEM14 family protein [Labilithrix sp.]